MSTSRPPLPPFSFETAVQKVRQAEDAWNTRDPERIALAYTEDSRWRNRAEVYGSADAQKKFVGDFVAAWNKVMNADRFDFASDHRSTMSEGRRD